MNLDEIRMKLMMNRNAMWYSSILLQLDCFMDNSTNTACTDGKTLRFNQKFWDKQSNEQKVGLVLHELRHVTDMHFTRMATRDSGIWNKAADHVINLDILSEGYSLPDN